MRRTRATLAAALAVTLPLLSGCGDGAGDRSPTATPSPTPSSTAPAPSATPTSATPSATDTAEAGTSGTPAAGGEVTDLLDWQPVRGSVEEVVTSNGEWTLTVAASRREAVLAGPGGEPTSYAARRTQVSDALLSATHAVVVLQDRQEVRPARAVVVDLASGRETVLDGRSQVPTTTGGTWALGPTTLVHATYRGQEYCLATVDLASGAGTRGWCTPPQTGFNNARVTAAGTTVQSFDGGGPGTGPACRTVGSVTGTTFEPFPGPPECAAWDALLLESGPVWSVVLKENNVEAVRLEAQVGDRTVDLGPGTSGTLTACGDAAYFVRDPQRSGEPARVLRWDGAELAVVYESPAGEAFMEAPRCGGDVLTVTARTESGDEQVTARVR